MAADSPDPDDMEMELTPTTFEMTDMDTSRMEEALANPLILNQIFAYLDYESVETARLVCHSWNSIILSATPPLLELQVERIQEYEHDDDEDDEDQIGPFLLPSRELWRKVCLDFDYQSYTNLHKVCELYGGTVLEAEWRLQDYSSFPSIFFQVMEHFPNLTNLAIRVCPKPVGTMKKSLIVDTSSTKLKLLKLVDLFIVGNLWPESINNAGLLWPDAIDPGHAREITSNIIQPVINSSPNLERLELGGNYYPDLSSQRCPKLVKLSWSGAPFAYTTVGLEMAHFFGFLDPEDEDTAIVENNGFKMKKLCRMLDKVATSLVTLRLGVQDSTHVSHFYNRKILRNVWVNHTQIQHFRMPALFPNLKVFKNKSLLFFPLPTSVFKSFPQLETLGLSESVRRRESDDSDLPELAMAYRNPEIMSYTELFLLQLESGGIKSKASVGRIKKLKIDFITDSHTFKILERLFPNLKHFSFRIRSGFEVVTFLYLTDLWAVFNGMVSSWDWIKQIHSVDITLPYRIALKHALIMFMKRLETDKSMEPLECDGTGLRRLTIGIIGEADLVEVETLNDDCWEELHTNKEKDEEERDFFLGGNELMYNLLDPMTPTHKFFKSLRSLDQISIFNLESFVHNFGPGMDIWRFISDHNLPVNYRW